jgi:hypothetical protein
MLLDDHDSCWDPIHHDPSLSEKTTFLYYGRECPLLCFYYIYSSVGMSILAVSLIRINTTRTNLNRLCPPIRKLLEEALLLYRQLT